MTNFEKFKQRLTLDKKEGWIAGVCAGIANYFETDPAFVRVAVIISALFFPKLTIAIYLISWLVLDENIRPDRSR